MKASTVLLIAIPVLLVLAALLAVATTISRQRSSTGSLGREARKADRAANQGAGSGSAVATVDESEAARARAGEARQSLEPAVAGKPVVSMGGGLIRFGEAPADPETLGVNRRQFFNRSILGAQSLAWGGFSVAMIAFLWPSLSGGFGGKVRAGSKREILAEISEKKQPVYVPEARSYVNPYPEGALTKAKGAYSETVLPGLEAGLIAIFQKCVHLGCRVPWCQTSQWFECPCHGSKYNRVGEKKGGPAPRGLDQFPLEVEGDAVTIDTGTVVQGLAIGIETTGQEAEGPSCV